jgi:lipopolysaccharide transport system permease protein
MQAVSASSTRSSASPIGLVRRLWGERVLVRQIGRRDVVSRYKGSYLGVLWSLITPLLMLAVYAFVFSVIFKSRWGNVGSQSQLTFALTLFCGLLAYNVFAEVVSRAPTLVVGNPSYVKRVVFPLEILPVAALFTAVVNMLPGAVVLLITWVAVYHSLSSTIWLAPLMLLPLCMISLGLGWLLASLGVFIRDIAHPVTVLVQVLLFMSGIFYPISALPAKYQHLLILNPLVSIIENIRRTALWGQWPVWRWWAIVTLGSLVLMQIGYYWFDRSRKAFADVL